MPPLQSLSHSQVHVCIITVLSLGGLECDHYHLAVVGPYIMPQSHCAESVPERG